MDITPEMEIAMREWLQEQGFGGVNGAKSRAVRRAIQANYDGGLLGFACDYTALVRRLQR
jgi:hypothetical protein